MYPSLSGALVVGPTAEDQNERDVVTVTPAARALLLQTAQERLLRPGRFVGEYAGLRPATSNRDYVMEFDANASWLCIASVRSTGFTACLGIAAHAARLLGLVPCMEVGTLPVGFSFTPRVDEQGFVLLCGRRFRVVRNALLFCYFCAMLMRCFAHFQTHPLTLRRLRHRCIASL